MRVAVAWDGEPCDALIALHARRSHDSIARYAGTKRPLIVTLTGTDLYRDLPDSAEARSSLEMADRLIVLQDAALTELDASVRHKARVVYQSADPRLPHRPPKAPFRIVVIAHLRAEKWESAADEKQRGRRKLLLSFELPRGCYATLIVKRITRTQHAGIRDNIE